MVCRPRDGHLVDSGAYKDCAEVGFLCVSGGAWDPTVRGSAGYYPLRSLCLAIRPRVKVESGSPLRIESFAFQSAVDSHVRCGRIMRRCDNRPQGYGVARAVVCVVRGRGKWSARSKFVRSDDGMSREGLKSALSDSVSKIFPNRAG